MSKLRVRSTQTDSVHELFFDEGETLRAILDANPFLRPRARCAGTGSCGLCRVKILAGKVSSPTPNERVQLPENALLQGIRLACQARPQGDAEIEVLAPETTFNWQTLPEMSSYNFSGGDFPLGEDFFSPRSPDLAVAIDLGTTHIAMASFDLRTGKIIASRLGQNPQVPEGADIISRLRFAISSQQNSTKIQEQVMHGIADGLMDITSREGRDLSHVIQVALVGNSAMLALLLGRNLHELLEPANWAKPVKMPPPATKPLVCAWRVNPKCGVDVFPPLAGFIGSDLLADLVATSPQEESLPSLLVDFGTNTEIALRAKGRVLITSTAGGPAFECSGISCSRPFDIANSEKSTLPEGTQLSRSGNGIGFYGPALVDLVTSLLRSGILDSHGKFCSREISTAYAIPGQQDLLLTARDVDLFQQAKSAIGTAIQVLLRECEIPLSMIQRVFICGAFGCGLDLQNAVRVGLLPSLPLAKITSIPYLALKGCASLLFSQESRKILSDLRGKSEVLNLASRADFEELFLKNLYLRPLHD